MISLGNPKELVPQMREMIACQKGFWLTVTGSSMAPTLRHMQDSVFIAPLNSKPAKRDILLTQAGEHCLLHRVTKCDGIFLYYRGDAKKDGEGPLPKCDVIGIVTQVQRGGKSITVTSLYHFKCLLWKDVLQASLFAKRIIKSCLRFFRQ